MFRSWTEDAVPGSKRTTAPVLSRTRSSLHPFIFATGSVDLRPPSLTALGRQGCLHVPEWEGDGDSWPDPWGYIYMWKAKGDPQRSADSLGSQPSREECRAEAAPRATFSGLLQGLHLGGAKKGVGEP